MIHPKIYLVIHLVVPYNNVELENNTPRETTMAQDLKELATQALQKVNEALELCEGPSEVYEALEACRYRLEDVKEG
jgi:hypothetical protein